MSRLTLTLPKNQSYANEVVNDEIEIDMNQFEIPYAGHQERMDQLDDDTKQFEQALETTKNSQKSAKIYPVVPEKSEITNPSTSLNLDAIIANFSKEQNSKNSPFYTHPETNETYRIDYVLAVRKQNWRGKDVYEEECETEISRESKTQTAMTAADVRKSFVNNLENEFGLKVFRTNSSDESLAEFYLVNVPFEKLEIYAKRLGITKPIDVKYFKLADKLLNDKDSRKMLDRLEDEDVDVVGVEGANSISRLLGDINNEENKIQLNDDDNDFTATYNLNYCDIFEGRNSENYEDNFFSTSERIKIADFILNECSYVPDAQQHSIEFGLNALVNLEVFTKAYPLHDSPSYPQNTEEAQGERSDLAKIWVSDFKGWLYLRPLDEIREYFGEKVGLYFAWLQRYMFALVIASFTGLIPFLYGLISYSSNVILKNTCNTTFPIIMCPQCSDSPDCFAWPLWKSCKLAEFSYIMSNSWSIMFTFLMLIGSFCFLRFWERREYFLNYDWDLTDIDMSKLAEIIRPEYRIASLKYPEMRKNKITKEPEHFVPFLNRLRARLLSVFTIFFSLIVVLFGVVSIIVYQSVATYLFTSTLAPSMLASLSSSLISAVIITALQNIYSKVAVWLNDLEHHRTENSYEVALTQKLFWFNFVNYYSPVFYIAFLKEPLAGYPPEYTKIFGKYTWQGCGEGGCTAELSLQLFSTLLVKYIFYNNAKSFGLVWLKQKYKHKKHKVSPETTRWEQDYLLEDVDSLSIFGDYLEMVMQFGFVNLFCTTFSLSPILALVNTGIQLNLDARKYLNQQNRPVPMMVRDIGSWQTLLAQITNISVITNAFLIAFTSKIIPMVTFQWQNGNADGYSAET